MRSKPRRLSLVKFIGRAPIQQNKHRNFPFNKEDVYIFIGEIPNMPGHCVIAERESGKVHAGYHTESFHELTADEI